MIETSGHVDSKQLVRAMAFAYFAGFSHNRLFVDKPIKASEFRRTSFISWMRRYCYIGYIPTEEDMLMWRDEFVKMESMDG